MDPSVVTGNVVGLLGLIAAIVGLALARSSDEKIGKLLNLNINFSKKVDLLLGELGHKNKAAAWQFNESGELVGVQIVNIPAPPAGAGAEVLPPTIIAEQRSPEPPER